MADRIRDWHDRIRDWHDRIRFARGGGWFFECDGLMGERSHRRQVDLSTADETYFLS